MPINFCKFCNKTFETFSRPSKACSIKCRKKLLEKETGYYTKYQQSKRVGKGQDFNFDCKICSKSFKTRNPNQKYCSKDCRLESIKLKNKTKRQCETCQKPIKTRSKYCSEACKPKKEPKRCKVCGVAIKQRNTYCPTHKPTYKPVKPTIYHRTCPTCKKDFTSKRKNAKYCKKKCKPAERARRRISNRKSTKYKPKSVKWSDFKEIELSRPSKNHQLDHIIPLNHPKICGLHVPWNLQWLTKADNQKKSNSFDGTLENISWKE